MPIVLSEESPYDLMDVLGPFSVILQRGNFSKVEFTATTASAGKTARKITNSSSAFN